MPDLHPKLARLLDVANDAYNDGEGRINEELTLQERGDGLASFIRHELIETFDPEDNAPYQTASVKMQTAQQELESVIAALDHEAF